MLALKRLGFSLDEMARLTMGDYIALTDIAFGEDAPREDGVVPADQAAIDALLG